MDRSLKYSTEFSGQKHPKEKEMQEEKVDI